ncbi:MAG: hypothetical protein OXH76_04155 [Boseongicola sp.]|nr:hypothetical protein [Boseongicola sp.]MYH58730.1 hypothetical protein [Boseongicola sp. SB0675_bin_26]
MPGPSLRLADILEFLPDREREFRRGNLDLSMTSPVACNVTAGGKAMRAKESGAPELAGNLRLPM